MRAHGRAWAGRAPAFSFGALSHVPTLKGGGSDNLLYNILYNTNRNITYDTIIVYAVICYAITYYTLS